MNRVRLLAGLAVFLLFFGLAQLAVSVEPVSSNHAFTIPAGGYYYHIPFSYVFGAPVSVTWQVTSGGSVIVDLLTDAEYATYRAGGGLTTLASSDSPAGILDFDLGSGGTYHVLILHGTGSEALAQDVSLTMDYSGVAPTPFYLGLAALVAAVALFGVSARLRASRLGRPRSPQEIAESRGVTYFEGPKAPPRTPPGGA